MRPRLEGSRRLCGPRNIFDMELSQLPASPYAMVSPGVIAHWQQRNMGSATTASEASTARCASKMAY